VLRLSCAALRHVHRFAMCCASRWLRRTSPGHKSKSCAALARRAQSTSLPMSESGRRAVSPCLHAMYARLLVACLSGETTRRKTERTFGPGPRLLPCTKKFKSLADAESALVLCLLCLHERELQCLPLLQYRLLSASEALEAQINSSGRFSYSVEICSSRNRFT